MKVICTQMDSNVTQDKDKLQYLASSKLNRGLIEIKIEAHEAYNLFECLPLNKSGTQMRHIRDL